MVNSVKPKHNEKSWRDDKVDHVGLGIRQSILFKDTSPNYAIISNPCESPLYVSTSPLVSDKVADLVVPPFGRQIYAQIHGLRELHLMCYDGQEHSIIVKSWEGEFTPSAIPQSQQFSVANEEVKLGTVDVGNLPTVQTVAVNNLPPIQDVSVTNLPAKQNVSVADKLPTGDNLIGSVALKNTAGTEITNARYAQGDNWSTAAQGLAVGSMNGAFNGTDWDRWRNNSDGILLPRATRTTNDLITPTIRNYNGKGIMLHLYVTARTVGAAPNLKLHVRSVSADGIPHYIGNADFDPTAGGQFTFIVYPGATAATKGNTDSLIKFLSGVPIGKNFDVRLMFSDVTDITYSLSYSILL